MTADTLAPAQSQQDGAAPARGLTVREALRDALAEEMRADASVFLIGEDVAEARGAFGVSDGLLDEFGPRRVVDVPVAEAGFAGLAVGAAFAGLRPVVEFSNFSFALQAMDQIVNSAARTRYMSGGALSCPIVFRGPSGAAPRAGAQHAQDFAAWFAHIPGLKVVQPYSAADAKGLLKSAIRDPDPVVFLENETLYARTFAPVDDGVAIPLGKARIWQEGTDVTLVSFGVAMARTLEAARALAREGVSAEVIDLRCLRPLDHGAVLASVRKTNRCVTVEEGLPVCSIGDHLGATIMREAFDWLDAPVLSVTGADVPMPYAESLEALALPSARDVVEAARAVCGR